MEYVGRRVTREFQGRGTFLGSVQAYSPATGSFVIVYDDGGSEELNLWQLFTVLMTPEAEVSETSPEREAKKARLIVNEGKVDDDSLTASGISGSFEDRSRMEIDLNFSEGVDMNDDGDHVGDLGKLVGLDLNKGVDLELHEGLDLNKSLVEESSGVEKEMSDLNLSVNEEFDNVSGEKKVRWFDLNIELIEGEVSNLDAHEGCLGANAGVCYEGDKHKGQELDMDYGGGLVNVHGENGNVILDMGNKEGSPLENSLIRVDYEKAAQLSYLEKGLSRKREEVLDNNFQSDTPEMIKVTVETGNSNLNLGSREETPVKRISDSLDCDGGVSGSAPRGRRCRKRRESSDNDIAFARPERRIRCSSLGAERDSFSGHDYGLNPTGINNQLPYPAISASSAERITVSGHERSDRPFVLPPKVKLPPSSCGLDLSGVSAFDFVSVYAFLRSFNTLLFLSPFELDDFVTCVKCNDSTLLFNSIHVSLLKTLRLHLESLSSEGSLSATNCLRSLNWDFLDLITWPVFVVEYLLLHSPGYIPGLDLCHFEHFQNDYYKMPVSAKVEILRHLCDDVTEIEVFRSELNRRTSTTERQDVSKRGKALIDDPSIIEEDIEESPDSNGDECLLCKMDGSLICCDGCPAAFHSRCVGVVSSQLPEGFWYCPECEFNKDKSWLKMGTSIRGAELLGTDPHGCLYYSSSGCLLVLESCRDECSSWFFKRNDLPAVVEVLGSSTYYDRIATAIFKHWNIASGVGSGNDLDSRSYSVQSAFPEKRILSIRHPTPSQVLNKDGDSAEKWSDGKSTLTNYSCNSEIETSGHVSMLLETGKDGVNMENQLMSSDGSAEVSQAYTMTDTLKEGGLDLKRCSENSDDTQNPGNLVDAGDHLTSTTLNVEQGNKLSSAHCGHASSTINSRGIMPDVPRWTHYVNFYEFARTASWVSEELASKSSDKSSDDAMRSVEEIIACQMKVISNRSAVFSWSNIQNSNLNSRKEKCGWCFYCKVPEDERECLFSMNDSIPAVENFKIEVLGVCRQNRKNHLIDVICQIICTEDHLQGLLSGPWLNPDYSKLWRKSVTGVDNLCSIKNLLLQLESNLHHQALSTDWRKHVDSVGTMGSASHIMRSTARVSLKHGSGRKRGKCLKLEVTPSSKAKAGLRLFWWRGGTASRKLFNWKVLPCSLALKAARQGGFKKISGIHYPDSGEHAKRTKYVAWRAAVESSRSVEQLALQVRELDANIRWDDILNSNLLSRMNKESKKPIKSFKKVIIRKKSCEGEVVRYLLDFGKKRFIPDIVTTHGSVLHDSSNERKKYWLEESHVPLHLLKTFEEKRIARNSNKTISGELGESITAMRKPIKRKGFTYLFSRAESSENYQCGHCNKDILIRDAVSCQYCKGCFHKRNARKIAGSISAESTYACHKCQERECVDTGATEGKSKSPRRKKALKALKTLCFEKERKLGKDKQPEKRRGFPLAVKIRSSARNAEHISKLCLQNAKGKKWKRGKQAKPIKDKFKKLRNGKWQKKRTPVNSSYWLNGVWLSRKENDERLMHFRSKMLIVLSGEETLISEKPKCSLCSEIKYTSKLNYVACQLCGVWFHGDAFDIRDDKIRNIIGFKCHNCLNKKPPVCPHLCPAGSDEAGLVSENNAETDDGSADMKS